MSSHTGTLIDMTAEPAACGAAIVVAHALAFLLIAYLATLMRHGRQSSRTWVCLYRRQGPLASFVERRGRVRTFQKLDCSEAPDNHGILPICP
jgi:hypothetical protein